MSDTTALQDREHEARRSGPRAQARASRPMWLAVLALTALSLAVRLWGIGYLLPMAFIGDGSVPVTQVRLLRAGGDPGLGQGDALFYPYLLAHLAALAPEEGPGDGVARSLAEHLDVASRPWRDVRVLSALLSILAIPGTWLLLRRFLGDGWALLGAAFFATSLMHADFSAQERPHGMLTTFVLFAVLAALRLRRRPSVPAYLVAGVSAGLAIGTLQSGLAVLPAFLAAIVLQERAPGRASRWWMLASLAIVAVFVRWLYPFHFVSETGSVELGVDRGESAMTMAGHVVYLEGFDGSGFRRMLTSLWFWDPVLLFALVLGLALFVVRLTRRERPVESSLKKDLLVVGTFVLPFLVVNGVYTYTLERFLLPVFPMYAGLAAYGVLRALQTIGRVIVIPARAVPWLAALPPALAALPVLQLARIHGATDTYELAARWLRTNVAPGETIVAVPYVETPVFHDATALEINARAAGFSEWVAYQRRMRDDEFEAPRIRYLIMPPTRLESYRALQEDPLAYFVAQGGRYVLIRVPPPSITALHRAREALREKAELVLRTTPERVDSGGAAGVYALHDDEGPASQSPFRTPYGLTLFDYDRMGATLELYRLPPRH